METQNNQNKWQAHHRKYQEKSQMTAAPQASRLSHRLRHRQHQARKRSIKNLQSTTQAQRNLWRPKATRTNDRRTTASIEKRAKRQQHQHKHRGSATGFAIVSIKRESNLLRTYNQRLKHWETCGDPKQPEQMDQAEVVKTWSNQNDGDSNTACTRVKFISFPSTMD